jgi:hypothetical protein
MVARKFWEAQAGVNIVIVDRQGTPISDDSFLVHFLFGLLHLSWILSPQRPKLIRVTRFFDLEFLHRGCEN